MEDIIKGRISAIYIKRDKKADREVISHGIFRKDYGLEGDFYTGKKKRKERQVILLSLNARRELEQDMRVGFCFGRFHETIQVDGISLATLREGTRFSAGDVLLEVSAMKKRCFSDCKIIERGETCILIKNVLIARVLKTGEMNIGDPVTIKSS